MTSAQGKHGGARKLGQLIVGAAPPHKRWPGRLVECQPKLDARYRAYQRLM